MLFVLLIVLLILLLGGGWYGYGRYYAAPAPTPGTTPMGAPMWYGPGMGLLGVVLLVLIVLALVGRL